ncbi:MAG: hypothetical protein VX603_12885, partial [Gemmatimonadota bacterium]|nr:hypothetical protein [Gemmatimonadota bacterium]
MFPIHVEPQGDTTDQSLTAGHRAGDTSPIYFSDEHTGRQYTLIIRIRRRIMATLHTMTEPQELDLLVTFFDLTGFARY